MANERRARSLRVGSGPRNTALACCHPLAQLEDKSVIETDGLRMHFPKEGYVSTPHEGVFDENTPCLMDSITEVARPVSRALSKSLRELCGRHGKTGAV